MPQANSRSIISSSPKQRAKRALSSLVHTLRTVVGVAVFSDPRRQTILVPVRDNGWAPDFRCGEFAIVETTLNEPADGAFIYRRCRDNTFSITKLRLWNQKSAATIIPGPGRTGPYWSIVYGRSAVGNWKPEDEWWAPGGFVHMSDGPLCDKFLREEIIGRVVGVLGDEERSINWRTAQ